MACYGYFIALVIIKRLFIMKKALFILIAGMLSLAAISQPTLKTKPSLTQSQWEAIMDAQKDYMISIIKGLADSSTKRNSLIAVLPAVQGMTKPQLEEKMEEFYGSDWKNAGGPLHTGCNIVCAITFSVCWDYHYPIWTVEKYCRDLYKTCMAGCGLLPAGL